MSMKFNKEQALAINTIDKNVCVVAGAGTGKTAILTHRFINIIKDSPLEPREAMEKILAITFTKKATNEMVDRIGREILKLESEDPKFQGLYNDLAFLNVSTIDSFCQSIIRENAFKIGLPFDYEIIEEARGSSILDGEIRRVFDDYLERDPLLREFLVAKNLANEGSFLADLKSAYKKIQSKGYDFDDLLSKSPLENIEEIDLENFIFSLDGLLQDLTAEKIINGRHKIVKDWKNGILEDLKSDNKDLVYDSLYRLKDGLKKIEEKADVSSFQWDLGQMLLTFEKEDLVYYDLINRMLKDLDENFRKAKKDQGLVEFSDLLYYTDLLLDDPQILQEVKDKYKYIMIDEFQDTNSYQKKIFYKIASDEKLLDRNNIFVVGDPKQSIYGFRGSDLKVFQEVRENIEKSSGLVIELKENYRSSDSLVTYANALFSKLMEEDYTALEAKISWAKDEDLNKNVQYIKINSPESKEMEEGELVARKILALKEEGRELSDIGVLFRSSTRLSNLEYWLSKYNIPYINPKSREFYNKREIVDLILFFKFLNNPQDSEALYGLLRSNFFLIDDNSLFKLAKESEDSLYENLRNYSGENKDILYGKDVLLKTLSMKDKVSIYEIFKYFISATSYYEFLSLTGVTSQEVENIKKFEELIISFEDKESSSINEFLSYILLEEKDDLNEAFVLSNHGAVNLMTIHASKGLEFKTVIFYDSQNNTKKESGTILINDAYGYGLRTRDSSQALEIVQSANLREEEEERKRLLYVCITRAQEDLIFISLNQKDRDPKKDPKAKNFLQIMEDLEGYDYDLVEEIPDFQPEKKEISKITSDESLVENKDFTFEKIKKTTSISAYMVYKRCPREYYYKYVLGLRDGGLLESLEKDKEDFEASLEDKKDFKEIEATTYGSLVHSIIENLEYFDKKEDLIDLKLREYSVESSVIIRDRVNKNIEAYERHVLPGRKFFEFSFLYDLGQGFLNGSIDQVILRDGEVQIVDFKTNSFGSIEELVKTYKDQILIYALAAEEIFSLPVTKAYLLFLEKDKLVEIDLDKKEMEKLKKDINSFLRFIGDNDSIDKYNYCQTCADNCKYKFLCNR